MTDGKLTDSLLAAIFIVLAGEAWDSYPMAVLCLLVSSVLVAVIDMFGAKK